MRFFLLILSSLLSNVSFSQDSTITLSHFEQFSSQNGRLLKTESKLIGEIGGLMISTIKSIDANTGQQAAAIMIGTDNDFLPSLVHTRLLYIDSSEVDSVIQALSYFIAEEGKQKPGSNVRYSYITATDVEIASFYSSTFGNWRLRIGKLYQKLRTPVTGGNIVLNKRRVTDLVEILKQAKSTIL
jgi:hypothetical protein